MGERIKPSVAVHVALLSADRRDVYMQQRGSERYRPGWWEIIAGKAERGESIPEAACRETYEEAGIEVAPNQLRVVHLYHNDSNPDHAWVGYIFEAIAWQGVPKICEPDKCTDAGFFPLDKLPVNTLPQVRDGLARLSAGATVEFSYYGPGSIDPLPIK